MWRELFASGLKLSEVTSCNELLHMGESFVFYTHGNGELDCHDTQCAAAVCSILIWKLSKSCAEYSN